MFPKALKYFLFVFIGFVIGFNVGGAGNTLNNLWDSERDGLRQLNERMAEDKSERLAVCVMTQKSVYVTQALDADRYKVQCGILEKKLS